MKVILPQHFLLPLLWPTNNNPIKLMHVRFICTRSIIVYLKPRFQARIFLLAYIEFQILVFGF